MTNRSRQEQEVTQVSQSTHYSSSEATKLKEAAEKAIKALEENPNQDTLKKPKKPLINCQMAISKSSYKSKSILSKQT